MVEVRQRYPDWGARKLQVVLAREGISLARNTVHGILLRRGLIKDGDQHSSALQRFERGQPTNFGQMDFKEYSEVVIDNHTVSPQPFTECPRTGADHRVLSRVCAVVFAGGFDATR